MKKKLYLLVLSVVLCMAMCCGCSHSGSKHYNETTNNMFAKVPISDNLYYDTNTKIVYVMFNEEAGYNGFGYMSPYYSENGKLYKFKDNKLCEIQK